MITFQNLVVNCLKEVEEVFPWDLADMLEEESDLLLLDIREPYEFDAVHIQGSLNVPRGILETACEYGYEETVPELANARDREIIVICRSGNRSALAAHVMQLMGYQDVKSLKTGIRGWNDFEQSLQDKNGKIVDIDMADEILAPRLRPEQMAPLMRPHQQPKYYAA